MSKPLKQKKCKSCRELFTPFNSMAKACSVPCAIALGKTEKEKEFNRVTREKKQAIKSRGAWLKEAQAAFNRWVRLRDSGNPCISCLRHHDGQYHAGHYKTVGGNPELRFDERNCHKQCSACNNHLSGNIVNYRINLIAKMGIEIVRELEGPHEPKKYTIDDIKAIKAEYNAKYREIRGKE